MRTNRFFTLLEVVVGLALILMAAGAIGWKMHKLIETRRFVGDLEQLKSRMKTIQIMAVTMQADWEGILKQEGNGWTFEAICLDPPGSKSFSEIRLSFSEIVLNEKSQKQYPFFFSSSGEVRPSGSLYFSPNSKNGKRERWDLPDIFGKKEGSGGGPTHPDESAS